MISNRMQTAYDRVAKAYAARYTDMPPVLATLAQRFLDHLPPSPAILDAGCGNGRDMAWFEAHGCQVTGIDLSSRMLEQARRHVSGSLLQMDMTALDLPSASFDGIWCMASLLHIPKDAAPGVLTQFCEVLKPGAILVLGLQEGKGEGWEPRGYGDVERYFARYQPAEITNILESAGFTVLALSEHRSSTIWLHIIAQAR